MWSFGIPLTGILLLLGPSGKPGAVVLNHINLSCRQHALTPESWGPVLWFSHWSLSKTSKPSYGTFSPKNLQHHRAYWIIRPIGRVANLFLVLALSRLAVFWISWYTGQSKISRYRIFCQLNCRVPPGITVLLSSRQKVWDIIINLFLLEGCHARHLSTGLLKILWIWQTPKYLQGVFPTSWNMHLTKASSVLATSSLSSPIKIMSLIWWMTMMVYKMSKGLNFCCPWCSH